MSKKLPRIMILSFLIIISTISYNTNLLSLAFFGCFWLGFVVSAIIFKEMDNLTFWATSKGIPTGLLTKEDKNARTEKKSDGKTERET